MTFQTEMHTNIFTLKQNLLPFSLKTGVHNTFFPVRYFQLNHGWKHQTGADSSATRNSHKRKRVGKSLPRLLIVP